MLMTEKIDFENWCPIHRKLIRRNQLECFDCKVVKENKLTSSGVVVWETEKTNPKKGDFRQTRHETLLTKYGVELLLSQKIIMPVAKDNPNKVYQPKNIQKWLKFLKEQESLI